MINKIKTILEILSNNIEQYCVNTWKYKNEFPINEDSYTEWQVQFIKDNKRYCLNFRKDKNNNICFSIYDKTFKNLIGKTIKIEVPSDEITEIELLFGKIILNSEKYIRNELNKLEL